MTIITERSKLTVRSNFVDLDDKLLISEINHALISELTNTKPIGAGLAAIQIGYDQRMFVMNCKGRLITLINPSIIKLNNHQKRYMVEGCLSRPGIQKRVPRYVDIRVRFHDLNGKKVERNFTKTNARIFQHELDHLNGKLI